MGREQGCRSGLSVRGQCSAPTTQTVPAIVTPAGIKNQGMIELASVYHIVYGFKESKGVSRDSANGQNSA